MNRLVLLTWKDAQESDGTWTDMEDIKKHSLATCQEAGWLVHQDEEKVIVMRSRIVEEDDEIKEGGAFIAIPSTWIIDIKNLEVVKDV